MAGAGGLAEQVRTGLEETPRVVPTVVVAKAAPVDPLDELWFGKTKRQHVAEFACVMSILMLIIAGVRLWHYHLLPLPVGLLTASLVLLAFGYKAPRILMPVWSGWMTFAGFLGHIMTTVILSVGWMILMIPLALALRIMGKKVMDCSYKAPVDTYWENRDPKLDDFKLLERQF